MLLSWVQGCEAGKKGGNPRHGPNLFDLVKGEGEECVSGRLKSGQFWLDIKREKPGFLHGWVPRRRCPRLAPRLTQIGEEEKRGWAGLPGSGQGRLIGVGVGGRSGSKRTDRETPPEPGGLSYICAARTQKPEAPSVPPQRGQPALSREIKSLRRLPDQRRPYQPLSSGVLGNVNRPATQSSEEPAPGKTQSRRARVAPMPSPIPCLQLCLQGRRESQPRGPLMPCVLLSDWLQSTP